MKNILRIMIAVLVFSMVSFSTVSAEGIFSGKSNSTKEEGVSRSTSSDDEEKLATKKDITLKIVSYSKKSIKLKLTNKSSKEFRFSLMKLTLKKKVNKKWKKVKFKKDAAFPKCLYRLEGNSSKTYKIKWKDYYEKNLSNGQYKITWVKTKKFKVK